MQRIQAIDPALATGQVKQLLDGVNKKLGMTPNMMRTMAASPAVLSGYLGLAGTLSSGLLPAQVRERLALAVGEANRCGYCLSAHTALGSLAGLSQEEIETARQAKSGDAKIQAALQFAQALVVQKGEVSGEQVWAVREAGWGEGEVAEIVAHVALNVFTNYFNLVAQTEIDFPVVTPGELALVHSYA
ncbi:MAG: carboxymuconolactone decarboxylase family protein [Acidobacteriota bacterium]